MILFIREIKSNMKSFIIWTVCIVSLIFLSMSMFPSFSADAGAIEDMMKNFPEEMKKALNISSLNLGEALDYFTYIFQYVLLFAGIQFMLVGASMLSKEETEKTIEFLYAKPITKNYIVTSKLLTAIVQILVFNVTGALFSVISFNLFADNEYKLKTLVLLWLSVAALQLFFLSVGFLISIFIKKTRQVMPVALGVVLGTYFISIISSISDQVSFLKYITPFKYFDGIRIIRDGSIDTVYIIICFFIILASVTATYVCYNNKDMNV